MKELEKAVEEALAARLNFLYWFIIVLLELQIKRAEDEIKLRSSILDT